MRCNEHNQNHQLNKMKFDFIIISNIFFCFHFFCDKFVIGKHSVGLQFIKLLLLLYFVFSFYFVIVCYYLCYWYSIVFIDFIDRLHSISSHHLVKPLWIVLFYFSFVGLLFSEKLLWNFHAHFKHFRRNELLSISLTSIVPIPGKKEQNFDCL